MSEFESLGEMVTGGIAARAVEPRAGEVGPDGHSTERNCLNCDAPLVGEFCHACGQHAHVHRTFGAFWHDFLHGVLHFEGKIWRTLPMLAWRPGELTRRYIGGERAKFVSPLALFLFSAFLTFALLSLLGGAGDTDLLDQRTPAQQRAEAKRDLDRELAQGRTRIAALERERATARSKGENIEALDAEIATERSSLALEQRLYRQSLDLIAADEARDKAIASGTATASEDDSGIVVVAGWDRVNHWFDDHYKKAKKNPSLLFYKLQNNAYKWSWALIPISIPFVWLLFLNRRRYRAYRAYDHAVFVTYSLSFMSLALIVMSVAVNANFAWLIAPIVLFLPVHIYRQLKQAYALTRASALWRTAVLIVFAFVALALFGLVILALGVS